MFKDVAFDGTTIYSFDDLDDSRTFICRHPATSDEVKVALRKLTRNSPDSPVFFSYGKSYYSKVCSLLSFMNNFLFVI